jgi:hypothetical protein
MFREFQWSLVAVLLAALGYCPSTQAQLYSAPDVGTVQNRYGAPNIATRMSGLSQAIRGSGFGGGNAPSNMPSMSGGARIGLGVNTSSSGSKPFSSYTTAPTVSPYLNLFRNDLNGQSDFNYSTLVKPQLQQQQLNQQLERQNLQTNRRLTSIAAQADFNAQGSKDEYPTGHQTVFNYMGHYYQTPVAHRKKAGQQ